MASILSDARRTLGLVRRAAPWGSRRRFRDLGPLSGHIMNPNIGIAGTRIYSAGEGNRREQTSGFPRAIPPLFVEIGARYSRG
jgi:hypothetical protein